MSISATTNIDNIFYVYIYFDPRKPGNWVYGEYIFEFEPFYVGNGMDDRIDDHLIERNLENDTNKHKTNKIKKIIKETGKEPLRIKFQENMAEKDAFNLEILMIATIGRYDLGKGPLTNMTDGGTGGLTTRWNTEERNEISKRMKEYIANLPKEEFDKRMEQLNNGYENYISIEENRTHMSIIASTRKREPQTEVTKNKISRSNIGKHPDSEEKNSKIRQTIQIRGGRSGDKNGMFGKTQSNEAKYKISQKRLKYLKENQDNISKYKYLLTKADVTLEIYNLKNFCLENSNFTLAGIRGSIRYKRNYKGWNITQILRKS